MSAATLLAPPGEARQSDDVIPFEGKAHEPLPAAALGAKAGWREGTAAMPTRRYCQASPRHEVAAHQPPIMFVARIPVSF